MSKHSRKNSNLAVPKFNVPIPHASPMGARFSEEYDQPFKKQFVIKR
jgi:hypothetical protein